MRRRLITLSANKLRKQFKTFDNYVSQEKLKTSFDNSLLRNDSMLLKPKEAPRLTKKLPIVISAKRLETITPVKRQSKNSVQASSVSKLFTGAIDDSINLKTTLTKDPSFEYLEYDDFQKYINNLKTLSLLSPELEMNFEVSRNSRAFTDVSLGIYYQIDEEIKKYSNLQVNKTTTAFLTQGVTNLTSLLREILRVLRYKQLDDEASILEVLWRGNVKLIDTALHAHELQTLEALNEVKKETNCLLDKSREDLTALANKHEAIEQRLQDEISELKQSLKALKRENKLLEEKLNQKEGLLEELNDIDRFEVLRNTSKLLSNLGELLEEVSDEKSIQVQVISNLNKNKLDLST